MPQRKVGGTGRHQRITSHARRAAVVTCVAAAAAVVSLIGWAVLGEQSGSTESRSALDTLHHPVAAAGDPHHIRAGGDRDGVGLPHGGVPVDLLGCLAGDV